MSSFAAASAQKFAFRAAPAKTVANKKIAQRSSRRVASLRVEAAKKSVGDLAKGDLEGNKGLGRVVAGGLVGRARKNALIEGISDAVVVVDDDVFFTTTTTTTTTISLTPHF